MWYWGAHAMQHLGRVIIVGGDPQAVRRLGFTPGVDAGRRARDGRPTSSAATPTITHLHTPPLLMADVT